MPEKKKLAELYKEVFLINYSSKKKVVIQSSSINDKNALNLFLEYSDCLISSSLSSCSSLSSHFREITTWLNNNSIDKCGKKIELVAVVQPHNDVAIAGYVFDYELIQQLAACSLGLGLTLVRPELENTISLPEKRKSFFISRREFNWDRKKYMYSNHSKAHKLTSINLSFSDDNLVPDAITEVMGTKPDHSSFKGQLINSQNQRKSRTGTWLLSCEDDEDGHKTLHDALIKSLNDLYKYEKRIFQVTQKYNCKSDISIAFNASFSSEEFEHYRFSPDLFKALKPFGVDLALSIWMV